jgi:hypothetical protein
LNLVCKKEDRNDEDYPVGEGKLKSKEWNVLRENQKNNRRTAMDA